eukprot:6922523-Lingulodinium_polyedra.AAC.1
MAQARRCHEMAAEAHRLEAMQWAEAARQARDGATDVWPQGAGERRGQGPAGPPSQPRPQRPRRAGRGASRNARRRQPDGTQARRRDGGHLRA